MRILIAPDSFKESLGAADVAAAIARGIRTVMPDAEIVCLPMADGGEGTLDAVVQGAGGEVRHARVVDALGRDCSARWAWIAPSTAFIEMASAVGLEQIAPEDRDIMRADTTGVGQLILLALDAGAREIVLTAGGSATNDGGTGMLTKLGLRLLDARGHTLPPGPGSLGDLAKIDSTGLDARLSSVEWTIATDVDNPLCGELGASAVFGPQKGANPAQVMDLDAAIQHFATQSHQKIGSDHSQTPGAGAGGGIGFAAIAWLDAKVRPGAEMVAELIGLQDHMKSADLVLTGEGRMDGQTLHGKAPMQVIRTAHECRIPVIALAGSLGPGYTDLYKEGLTAAFSLVSGPMSLEDACAQADSLLAQRASDIMRVLEMGATVLSKRQPS